MLAELLGSEAAQKLSLLKPEYVKNLTRSHFIFLDKKTTLCKLDILTLHVAYMYTPNSKQNCDVENFRIITNWIQPVLNVRQYKVLKLNHNERVR